MKNSIRIGSRGSDLALWQAKFFQKELLNIGVTSEIIIITTKGDRIQDRSFDKIEGKGFFTKEIEEQLLSGHIDIAIHSHKDLETNTPEGLIIAGVSYRENPADLLLIHASAVDESQPLFFKKNAVVGTSSARRKSQIKSLRSDISIKDIRGNVPTRINKLRQGEYDAILLAAAGVARLQLDLDDLKTVALDPRIFIPAPAQGVLAYQCRLNDVHTAAIVKKLHHQHIENASLIERGILNKFGGGCHIPIGVYARPNIGDFTVWVTFGSNWEDMPMRMRFNADNHEVAIKKFTAIRSATTPKRVFITKQLSSDSYFLRACSSHGIQVTHHSLIETVNIPFSASPTGFDWVVFSSSNGVDAFFDQENMEDWKHLKFGAAGAATAATLSGLGIQVSFAGEESDMDVVAQALTSQIGTGKTLFPVSDRSKQSLQSHLLADQCESVVCYKTVLQPTAVAMNQAYIFTSPSNVEAFFQINDLPKESKAIAIGSSTSAALAKYGVKSLTAEIPTETEMFSLLAVDLE